MPDRWGPLQVTFGVLAAFGMLLFGIAVAVTANHCSNECDAAIASGWFEKPGAWEKWVQLGAATLVALPLAWAALAAFRGHGKGAAQRAFIAIMPLAVWIILIGNA